MSNMVSSAAMAKSPPRLIAPFGDADPTGAAYYLCRASAAMPTVAERDLERWLTMMAAERNGANTSAAVTT